MSPTGQKIRDQQMDLFELQQAPLLEQCRAAAVAFARRHGQVSINEVREFINLPPGTHPSVLGAVFRTRQFRAIGYVNANHPAAHARAVRVYALKEQRNG